MKSNPQAYEVSIVVLVICLPPIAIIELGSYKYVNRTPT